jgi:hypothetical protein
MTNSTNSIATDSIRLTMPAYCSFTDKHLGKRLLNALRSKCNASAGPVEPKGSGIRVVDNSIGDAQRELEQRIGISLHVLRTILLGNSKEGFPVDLALRLQKEVDFKFIDRELFEVAFDSALDHYLGHAGISHADFKKWKREARSDL